MIPLTKLLEIVQDWETSLESLKKDIDEGKVEFELAELYFDDIEWIGINIIENLDRRSPKDQDSWNKIYSSLTKMKPIMTGYFWPDHINKRIYV